MSSRPKSPNRPASVSDPTPYYPRKRKASGSPDRQDIIDSIGASDPKTSATEAEYHRVLRGFNGDIEALFARNPGKALGALEKARVAVHEAKGNWVLSGECLRCPAEFASNTIGDEAKMSSWRHVI